MRTLPPTHDEMMKVIDDALDRGWPTDVYVAEAGAVPDQGEGTPPPQFQPCDALTLCLATSGGSGRFVIRQDSRRVPVPLRAGVMTVWPARSWNVEQWGNDYESLGIIFREESLRLLHNHWTDGHPKPQTSSLGLHTLKPLGDVGTCMIQLMREMAPAPAIKDDLREMARMLLRAARRHVSDDAGDRLDGEWHASLDRTTHVWRHVKGHISEFYADRNLSLTSTAHALGLSSGHLSRICKRKGQPFQKLLEQSRLNAAQQLLRETDFKLDHVASLTGYATATYFVRVFRRTMGMTPTEYRHADCGGCTNDLREGDMQHVQ